MAPYNDIDAFHSFLLRITAATNHRPARILALCGAGLSVASGLATFRGSTAALWHTHDPMELATPEAFAADPGLVWRFYAYRRHTALAAQPNAGHRALAALAEKLRPAGVNGAVDDGGVGARRGDFLCLTQNVDGLSPRAGHPPFSLRTLHGSLFDLRCVDVDRGRCDYVERDHFADPLCPALAFAAGVDETAHSTSAEPLPHIPVSELPTCPRCRERDGRVSLLRPGVVWFGEALDEDMLREINRWIGYGIDEVDLMLVIGTSAEVHPAASYIGDARVAGAVVATINLDAETPEKLADLEPGDFAFGGSAADLLPLLLEPLIGKLAEAE